MSKTAELNQTGRGAAQGKEAALMGAMSGLRFRH